MRFWSILFALLALAAFIGACVRNEALLFFTFVGVGFSMGCHREYKRKKEAENGRGKRGTLLK